MSHRKPEASKVLGGGVALLLVAAVLTTLIGGSFFHWLIVPVAILGMGWSLQAMSRRRGGRRGRR